MVETLRAYVFAHDARTSQRRTVRDRPRQLLLRLGGWRLKLRLILPSSPGQSEARRRPQTCIAKHLRCSALSIEMSAGASPVTTERDLRRGVDPWNL